MAKQHGYTVAFKWQRSQSCISIGIRHSGKNSTACVDPSIQWYQRRRWQEWHTRCLYLWSNDIKYRKRWKVQNCIRV